MPGIERLTSALADRYVIEREIGSGGMATVYLARDIKHDREVALKVLRSDLSAILGTERFLSEVRITAKLDHPHILTLIDSGEADGMLYYVLPYVRGESLRSKITRETQLEIDEALSIAKQIASALDYAHEKGVVHRDIKPENVLLHEGEAMLTDFGIALAVKEAGGARLTETGLSLGTPQYMSPEQATGDRAADRRSDVYSLGAVFYEMISGEPPITGVTGQAMIAKLLTERPVKLRVVRNSVSPSIEAATDKALSKVPADRFASAGGFARALSLAAPEPARSTKSFDLKWVVTAGLAVVVLAAAFAMTRLRREPVEHRKAALAERTQLTNTGAISMPTMSADGKALAYVITTCGGNGCRYGIEIKDIGENVSRRLFDGASAIYRVDISPDRRNLIFNGTYNRKIGSFIVSMVDGAPRYASYFANFYAGGDSLVMARDGGEAKSFWMLFSGLDAVPVDSVQIEEPGDFPPFYENVPSSSRIIARGRYGGSMHLTAVERSGKVLSSFKLPPGVPTGSRISADALWLYMNPRTGHSALVRVPFDRASMKFALRGDTVYTGAPTMMSVTADGNSIAFDEGISEYTAWTVPVTDLFKNRFADANRLVQGTNALTGSMSPDGKLSAVGRERNFSVLSAGTATEANIPGEHYGVIADDSSTLRIADLTATGTTLYLYDVRTHSRRNERTISDLGITDYVRLGDTWAWLPANGAVIKLLRDGETRPREIKPRWVTSNLNSLSASLDGKELGFVGFLAGNDSISVGTFSMADNRFTRLYDSPGEWGTVAFLDGGDLATWVNDTPESETLYRIHEGQPARRIGSTPRLISATTTITMSSDFKKAFVITREDRRDVWMARVVR
jgi:hypothetical protein